MAHQLSVSQIETPVPVGSVEAVIGGMRTATTPSRRSTRCKTIHHSYIRNASIDCSQFISGNIAPERTPLAPIRSIESSIQIKVNGFRTASYQTSSLQELSRGSFSTIRSVGCGTACLHTYCCNFLEIRLPVRRCNQQYGPDEFDRNSTFERFISVATGFPL